MHRAWTNLLLMIVICIAIFIIFIALRPAEASNITDVVKASWRWQRIKSFRIKNSRFGGPVAPLTPA
jgi:hypothetical protein